jgi:hypothetical protein
MVSAPHQPEHVTAAQETPSRSEHALKAAVAEDFKTSAISFNQRGHILLETACSNTAVGCARPFPDGPNP